MVENRFDFVQDIRNTQVQPMSARFCFLNTTVFIGHSEPLWAARFGATAQRKPGKATGEDGQRLDESSTHQLNKLQRVRSSCKLGLVIGELPVYATIGVNSGIQRLIIQEKSVKSTTSDELLSETCSSIEWVVIFVS